MNVFRRVLLIAVEILLVAVVTVMLLAPRPLAAFVGNFEFTPFGVRLLIAVVIDVLILAFVYFQVRPAHRTTDGGLMVKASGAVADVSIESARERIVKAVSSVPDVVNTEARLQAIRGKAHIELDVVVVDRNANIPAKQQEINRALKQVINKQLGLQLADRPVIHIQLRDETAPAPSVVVTPPPAVVVPPPISEAPEAAAPEAVAPEAAVPESTEVHAKPISGWLRSDELASTGTRVENGGLPEEAKKPDTE